MQNEVHHGIEHAYTSIRTLKCIINNALVTKQLIKRGIMSAVVLKNFMTEEKIVNLSNELEYLKWLGFSSSMHLSENMDEEQEMVVDEAFDEDSEMMLPIEAYNLNNDKADEIIKNEGGRFEEEWLQNEQNERLLDDELNERYKEEKSKAEKDQINSYITFERIKNIFIEPSRDEWQFALNRASENML